MILNRQVVMQRFEKWSEIYLQLLKADKERALEPKDLETLALAAYLTGRDAESLQILERGIRISASGN